ncbi:ciliary microtubule inner protein 2A [Pelobates fuscus]|uniref:ciliary microtubule inner protein 2A n=1 Tax=Pelobates fuscus TaxID=191477 RepID=UPI002FE4BCA2
MQHLDGSLYSPDIINGTRCGGLTYQSHYQRLDIYKPRGRRGAEVHFTPTTNLPTQTSIPMYRESSEDYCLYPYMKNRDMYQSETSAVFTPPAQSSRASFAQLQGGPSLNKLYVGQGEAFPEIHTPIRYLKTWPAQDIYHEGIQETVRRGQLVHKPTPIQRKAIPGYTGYIPCPTWSLGVSYIPGAVDRLDKFERAQAKMENLPMYPDVIRRKTAALDCRIYTSAGLKPKYTGFIPGYRDSFGYTYGDASRLCYWKYQHQE